jgi:hypothetical protein
MTTRQPRPSKDRENESPEGDAEPRLLEDPRDPPLNEQIGRAEDVAEAHQGDPMVGLEHDSSADQRPARSDRRNSSVSSGRL